MIMPKKLRNEILVGDCREQLRRLPEGSVHCFVTSPPYYAKRSYEGVPPTIWGELRPGSLREGENEEQGPCVHVWGDAMPFAGSPYREGLGANSTFVDRVDKGVIGRQLRPSGYLTRYDTPSSTLTTGTSAKRRRELTAAALARQAPASAGQFCQVCGAWRGHLGLEPSPDLFVEHMVEVFAEVWRVLRDDGTLWLNLGDSYTSGGRSSFGNANNKGSGGAGHNAIKDSPRPPTPAGLKAKDLIGIPWRVALALQAWGWTLRSDIIWAKPNPMPDSVQDRPTCAHEYVFLLTKGPRYYYDGFAIRGATAPETFLRAKRGGAKPTSKSAGYQALNGLSGPTPIQPCTTRNRRSVWSIATQAYKGAHFATFPTKLVEPCVMAGSGERGACPACGAPWVRVVRKIDHAGVLGKSWHDHKDDLGRGQHGCPAGDGAPRLVSAGWRPGCDCERYAANQTLLARKLPKSRKKRKREQHSATGSWAGRSACFTLFAAVEELHRITGHVLDWPVAPCVVGDPFFGSGTVGQVAAELRRDWIGCEASPKYADMARKRTAPATSLPLWEGLRPGEIKEPCPSARNQEPSP